MMEPVLVNDGWISSDAWKARYAKIDAAKDAFILIGRSRDVPIINDERLLETKEGWLEPVLYTGKITKYV